MEIVGVLLKLVPIVVVIAIVALLLSAGYLRVPPDVYFIISGVNKKPRILIGKAGFKIPFFERVDKLLARQITIDIKTNGYVPTKDFIGVDIDAVAKVRVMTDEDGIQKAMRNFLNMDEKRIADALTDSLQGNMREIIGTVTLKELCTDRKKFGDEVQAKAQIDMAALGIEIISCNIQKITDERDLITALGQDNMSQIQKDASIAKAQAERDIKIAEAEASREANEAQVVAETEIAQKQTELSVKKAELQVQADTKKAVADAAYEIQKQEQQRAISTATVNAQIAKTEREGELKTKEVEVTKRSLDASVRAKADADRYRQEQEAQADLFKRQKEAEAKKYEQIQAAEAAKEAAVNEAEAKKAAAEAEKYAKEQEAAGIRAVGEAEAAAIQAKALAEAEGIDKKAEAMQKMGQAAIIEMAFNALPEIAKNVAEPLTKVDHITMYGEGNTAKLLSEIVNGTSQVTEGISQSMGLDLKSLIAGAVGGKMVEKVFRPEDSSAEVVTPVAVQNTVDVVKDTAKPEVKTNRKRASDMIIDK